MTNVTRHNTEQQAIWAALMGEMRVVFAVIFTPKGLQPIAQGWRFSRLPWDIDQPPENAP